MHGDVHPRIILLEGNCCDSGLADLNDAVVLDRDVDGTRIYRFRGTRRHSATLLRIRRKQPSVVGKLRWRHMRRTDFESLYVVLWDMLGLLELLWKDVLLGSLLALKMWTLMSWRGRFTME